MTISGAVDVALDILDYRNSEGYVDRSDRPDEPDGRSFVWRDLRDKGKLDAAYFRGSVPLVGFAQARDTAELPSIHRRLWNLSRVPLLIAGTDEEAAVYSCFAAPSGDGRRGPELRHARNLDEIRTALIEFSRFHVESGHHARRYPDHFRREGRVDARLLENLRALRGSLLVNTPRDAAIDALIGRTMLVRYFEDRQILTKEHIARWAQEESFIGVLRRGVDETYNFFARLAHRFNGDIFVFEHAERELVDADTLERIAEFFSGDELGIGQKSLFPYDFSIIPSELISSIYEQLLEGSQEVDAAHYTPRHVVDLVLDEVLPWTIDATPRILDPACGSGIFLAEAFRRLAFRAKTTAAPSFTKLVEILTTSIFGVDINPAAVRVAAFGLYLALLEELDPPSAWREARLPQLVGKNLVVADFFADHFLADKKFDLIVGNPPWQSQLSAAARRYVVDEAVPVADLQVAFVFLWKTSNMLEKSGQFGVLMPARPLLHNKGKAVDVRREIFRQLSIDTVIDLTGLRRGLFQHSRSPACAVIGRPSVDSQSLLTESEILHVAPQMSPLQMSIDGFVVSQADLHRVPRRVAENSPDVWKTLLRGDDRDVDLIRKLRSRHKTLSDLVKQRAWTGPSRGVTYGGGKQVPVPHLVGKPLIPAKAIAPFAVDREAIAVMDRDRVERARDDGLFSGPHILVKRTLWRGRPAAVMLEEDAVFQDVVIGIGATGADAQTLRLITAYMNSSVWSYYHFLTSGSWGVERSTIERIEQMTFPVALPTQAKIARVLEVAKKAEQRLDLADVSWQSALDEAVFEAYEFTDAEVTLIKDTIEVKIDAFDRTIKSHAFAPPKEGNVRTYLSRLCKSLPEPLRTLIDEVAVSADFPSYRVASLALNMPMPDHSTVGLRSLIERVEASVAEWPKPATVIQPSAVLLDGNSVHLVKPNELRFWTASQAISDAAELVAALLVHENLDEATSTA